MNRRAVAIVIALSLLSACTAVRAQPPPDGDALSELEETFTNPVLNKDLWCVTRKNDFQESTIDIVEGRLRLRAATIGTKDDTVKYHGVRTRQPIHLAQPMEISFEVDWNNQANGCYLTAGVYLCPPVTDSNPGDESDWLKFEYIGVPPGQKARAWVSMRSHGGERVLYDEGWPEKQRSGRKIGRQVVKIAWKYDTLSIVENDQPLWETKWTRFPFPNAHLYLQMSSHSNYPPRTIFFDSVSVSRGRQ